MDAPGVAGVDMQHRACKFNGLAALEHASGLFQHEPAEGVAFAFGRFPHFFVELQDAVRVKQRRLRLHQVGEFVQHGVGDVFLVELVGDLTHNFFQDILQSHQPACASILVHYDSEVDFLLLEFPQEVVDFLALWDVHRGA